MTPYYQQDGITIYHGDCREILPISCCGKAGELILTDPPYGVGLLRGDSKIRCAIYGDNSQPDIRWMASRKSIIWGGNQFCHQLTLSSGWLVWFKHFPNNSRHSQAELAWSNVVQTVRHFSLAYHGFMRKPDGWLHPTQKPVRLMKWCLSLVPTAQVIIDPFMGSGPVLVAAKDLGLQAIGIEIEERYCEIAANRLRQGVLPLEGPTPRAIPEPRYLPLFEED